MKRSLRRLDPVYNSVCSYMSKKEKIMYCESLIKETEGFMKKTTRPLDQKTKARYDAIIEAAKAEMEALSEKK